MEISTSLCMTFAVWRCKKLNGEDNSYLRDTNMSCLHRLVSTSHRLHARTSYTISWKYPRRQVGSHWWNSSLRCDLWIISIDSRNFLRQWWQRHKLHLRLIDKAYVSYFITAPFSVYETSCDTRMDQCYFGDTGPFELCADILHLKMITKIDQKSAVAY